MMARQSDSGTPSSNCIYAPALKLQRPDFLSFSLEGEGVGGGNNALSPTDPATLSPQRRLGPNPAILCSR